MRIRLIITDTSFQSCIEDAADKNAREQAHEADSDITEGDLVFGKTQPTRRSRIIRFAMVSPILWTSTNNRTMTEPGR